MSYDRIVISSGHGKYVRGAAGHPGLDEVDEARKVTEYVADSLRSRGVQVKTYHDDVSKSQDENLKRIVDFHNAQTRDLDVSVHFNAFDTKAHGVEVCYLTQKALAAEVSAAIADAGFTDRGPKPRSELYFLNHTSAPAILIETCFCDNPTDCGIYIGHFDLICENIANVLGGITTDEERPEVPPVEPAVGVYTVTGTCSHFGGPDDMGVSDQEGLAFIYKKMDAPHLFLPDGAPGTEGKGLARCLNPYVHYLACRWNYDKMSKPELLKHMALVTAKKTGIAIRAFPADWGPHEEKTGRAADLSPKLMEDLGITTDDEVTVVFPFDAITGS